MAKNEVDILVPEAFQDLLTPARNYVYYGGRGSGKSWSIARYLICKSLMSKRRILCAREFQNSIAESVHSLLCDIIYTNRLSAYFKIKNTSIVATNGSEFLFKGLAHNIHSVKSTEGIDDVWVEEADSVSQNSWDILFPTIRRPGSCVYITFNPCHEDDPVYKMFVVQGMPDTVLKKVNWHDNPHFPDVLRKQMEHMQRTDYDKYLHVWEGELQTISAAQIFRGKYVVEEFDSDGIETFYFGMDFGFAEDPSVIVRVFIRNRNLYIDREQCGHHVEINHLHRLITPTMEGTESTRWQISADCSRPETIAYLCNNVPKFNVVAADKWQGSVEDGIEYIKSFDKIVIHPSCTNMIHEARHYRYKVDKKTNVILPIVVDADNHGWDAVRYALNKLIKRKVTIYDEGVL
jgi:phage terminase large subunit